MGVVAALLGNRKRLNLHGSQPGGELARKVLDQNTDEALDGAEAHAMQHMGRFLVPSCVRVLQVKVERHLEVELDGAALPCTTERVLQMEVDLRAVERAVALVDLVVLAQLLESGARVFSRKLPVLVRPMDPRAGGELDLVVQAELLVHGVDEVDRRP